MPRSSLKKAHRIVIKIGSRVLLENNGQPNYAQIFQLVNQIAELHKTKKQIIFVSSGAVGAGMEALGLKTRPRDLPTLQAAAALGQVRLMRTYEDLFATHGILVAQVLLTRDDLKNRQRHLNSKNTLNTLLKKNIIPIVNENDTVATEEFNFGDNDILGSLVALLVEAQVLVLLTTIDGFMIKNGMGKNECVPHIYEINQEIIKNIEEHKIGLSKGGMKSKLIAAANMIHVGGAAIIASGNIKNSLTQIFSGKNIGTLIAKPNINKQVMPGKKRWIAFYHHAHGVVIVDNGAKLAITLQGKSLLPVGVINFEGNFDTGSVLEIRDSAGKNFARGISQYSSKELQKIIKTNNSGELIHRDNLVLINGDEDL